MEMIENKIANSNLVTLDIQDYYPKGKRIFLDIKPFLYEGLVLREKEYRERLKNTLWEEYKDCFVAIGCSSDAIIPSWAYLLISVYLHPIAKKIVHGDLKTLDTILFYESIQNIDYSVFKDQKVLIKGCSDVFIPENTYVHLMNQLLPYAKTIMFGEACSTVPLYKSKI